MSFGTIYAHGVPTSYLRSGSTLSSPTRSYRIDQHINFVPESHQVFSGQALVYKALDCQTGKSVAIKQILNPHDQGVKERFRREATFLLKYGIGNPHIVQGVEAFAQDGNLFLVMEWIDGRNAFQIVEERGGPLAEREVLAIGMVLCSVIAFFHRCGYLFRDMNEGNLMVRSNGQVVVIDLGGILPHIRPRRATGLLPPGAAPEILKAIQENREAPFSMASDVYQICSVLYYLSVARFPEEKVAIIPPRTLNTQLSQAMDTLLRKGLSTHPTDRFATPGMLGNALAAVRAPSSTKSAPSKNAPKNIRHWVLAQKKSVPSRLMLLKQKLSKWAVTVQQRNQDSLNTMQKALNSLDEDTAFLMMLSLVASIAILVLVMTRH